LTRFREIVTVPVPDRPEALLEKCASSSRAKFNLNTPVYA